MHKRTIARSATTLGAVSALAVGVLAAAPGASAHPSRQALPNSAPTWLGRASHHGKTSDRSSVSARVYLAPNGGLAALKNAVAGVSTPGSATYRQFLSTAQYAARYAPTRSEVALVSSWLAGSGLRVTGVESHKRYLSVSGSVAAAQKAFGVSIHNYSHDGQNVQAPTGNVTLPDTVASSVLTVSGLDTTQRTVKRPTLPPPDVYINARPCSLYYGQLAAKYEGDYKTPLPPFNGKTLPYTVCGYTGPQLRSAYEGDTTLDGTGVTVAITDAYASPTMAADANRYAEAHGDGSYVPGQFSQVLPAKFKYPAACADPSGWYDEESLDVEAVHAMAPAANIRYYGAASCLDSDLLNTLQRVVDDNVAKLVTNSWADVEQNESVDNVVAYEQVFLQGAMQGISFSFSSGDDGDNLAATGLKQVNYPSSDPYVTSVGGTSDAITANGTFKFQTGWGTHLWALTGNTWTDTGFQAGGGGGTSALFNRPSYQFGVVPNSVAAGRAVPDVALDADPNTGFLHGLTLLYPDGSKHYGEYRIGGTSLASPLFAGMTALLLQNAGGPIGLLNPTIYGQAGSGTFSDIKGQPKDPGNVRAQYADPTDPTSTVNYSVRQFNRDSSLSVAPGWDDVTGVGSPNAGWITSVGPRATSAGSSSGGSHAVRTPGTR